MKKIFTLLILICVLLSLYSFVFLDGENLSFKEAYCGLFTYVSDIFTKFETITNVPIFVENSINGFINSSIDIYNKIVNALTSSFENMWINIKKAFGLSEEDDYMKFEPCDICGSVERDCICNIADPLPPGTIA